MLSLSQPVLSISIVSVPWIVFVDLSSISIKKPQIVSAFLAIESCHCPDGLVWVKNNIPMTVMVLKDFLEEG